ncbi:MAG: HEAT repeat domain-containing protein [Candidatus Eisenbacteria bacterium]
MPTPESPHWLVLFFAIAMPLTAIALVLLLVRSVRRSQRGSARLRAGELFRLLGGRVAGRVPARTLRRAVSGAEHESFWDAMEAITTTLRLRERLELSRSLKRSGHVAHERRLLRSHEPAARRELAARRLGFLPSTESRRALRRALVRGPANVSFAAARALARHRDLRALRWLLEHPAAVSSRPMPALSGLLRAFGPAARAMLIAALEQGLPDTRVECACIDSLGVARCRSARGSIANRLRSPHLELRVAAARALGRLGMGEAIPALAMALTDESWPVRAMAAQALGRLAASPAVDSLVACVSDRSWWVRHHAAYALAAIGDEGRDALCELAARSDDPYAREMAREALDAADLSGDVREA